MGTAVTTSGSADKAKTGNSAPPEGGSAPAGGFSAHRPNDGYATRLGLMAVWMGYVLFACHSWFYGWVMIRSFFESTFLSFLVSWSTDPTAAWWVQHLGTAVLAAAGFYFGYKYIYVKPNSAEFLIKTDGELGKVTWPKVSPWFKPDTQVWGATYVVLIVVAALTLFVFCVDFVLQSIAQWAFYGGGS